MFNPSPYLLIFYMRGDVLFWGDVLVVSPVSPANTYTIQPFFSRRAGWWICSFIPNSKLKIPLLGRKSFWCYYDLQENCWCRVRKEIERVITETESSEEQNQNRSTLATKSITIGRNWKKVGNTFTFKKIKQESHGILRRRSWSHCSRRSSR